MQRILLSALILAGCASAPVAETLDAYPAALAGRYDNSVQFAGAPADMTDPPSGPEDDWIDPQTVTFTPVAPPGIGPAAYVEWTRPDGTVSKQRLWVFRPGVRFDIHEFRAPDRFAGAPAAAFASLTPADLKDPIPGCSLSVTSRAPGAWDATTDPETCRAGDVAIDIRVTVMPTGILYQEQGRRGDGYAFRIPAPAPYEFRRR